MDYQKDTSNKDLNSYGHTNPIGGKSLLNNGIYEYINKKTEKLVTALYMVTDCMDTDDALKCKIRILGVELLSDMYKMTNLSPIDKKNQTNLTLSHINEILSLIEISCTIGFISDMNTSILKKELVNLISEFDLNDSKDKHFSFALDQGMFDMPRPLGENPNTNRQMSFKNNIKDMSAHSGKRTQYGMSFSNLSLIKTPKTHVSDRANKQDRSDKIVTLIKDKQHLTGYEEGVSIKDISTAFTDCSEKTIQRELNSLVSKGLIHKTGSKRWSRYKVL